MKTENRISSYIPISLCLVLSLVFFSCAPEAGQGCAADACGRCEASRNGLRICYYGASSNVGSQSVTLKNYTGSAVALNGYTLWNLAAYQRGAGQYSFGASPSHTIESGAFLTIQTGSAFIINSTADNLFLKDSAGALIDQMTWPSI